ncbi:MAG: hypothetical protein IPK26_16810 [Planctomycetes bacterium]|nr:hypothetical protein [Planctomycetota bacterium]
MTLRFALFAATVAAADAAAQIQLNTRLRDAVPITSTSWIAGNTGYRTATNRYLIQTMGNGLSIVDTTDPANSFVVRTISPLNVKEVKVYGQHAYATTDGGPTHVISLANPATAAVVNTIAEGAHTLQVDAARGLLYLNRASQNQLRILDVGANPVSPPLVVAHPLPDIHDSHPTGNICYVAGGSPRNVYILDVSALPTVTQIASFPVPGGYLHDVDVYTHTDGRKYLYTCTELSPETWLKIYDITVPTAATLVGQWWTSQSSTIHNVFIKGAYAYVAYYKDGLRVLDLSNPAMPQEVGIFDPNITNTAGGTFSGTWDVYPYHDAIYLDEMYNTNGAGTQGAWIVDFFPGFGTGCPGTGGVTPTQWWSYGPPSPGNSEFALRLENAAPGALAMLLIGFSNTTWGSYSLPLNLNVLGGDGCTLYTSPDSVQMFGVDANGKASYPLPIPAALSGVVWCQWGVLDAGAPNALDLAATNGGKLILK